MASGSSSGTGANDDEPTRAPKSTRMAVTVRKKKSPFSNPFAASNVTGTSRNPIRVQPSPSRYKSGSPFVPVHSTASPRPTNGTTHHQPQCTRMPSSATFNPTVPTQAPTYPALGAPRREESMLSLMVPLWLIHVPSGLVSLPAVVKGMKGLIRRANWRHPSTGGTNKERSDRNGDRTQSRQHHCRTRRPIWCTCWVITTFKC